MLQVLPGHGESGWPDNSGCCSPNIVLIRWDDADGGPGGRHGGVGGVGGRHGVGCCGGGVGGRGGGFCVRVGGGGVGGYVV